MIRALAGVAMFVAAVCLEDDLVRRLIATLTPPDGELVALLEELDARLDIDL